MKQLNRLTVKSVVIATVLVITLALTSSMMTTRKQKAAENVPTVGVAAKPITVSPSVTQTHADNGAPCDFQYDPRSLGSIEDAGGPNGTVADLYRVSQIPEKLVVNMTTSCLLDKVLAYPLWMNMLVYDTDQIGLVRLRGYFTALDTLIKRADSGEVLLKAYQNFDLSNFGKTPEVRPNMTNIERYVTWLTPAHKIHYIELMLGQPEVIAQLTRDQKTELLTELVNKRGFKQKAEFVGKVTGSLEIESIAVTAARVMLSLPEVNYQQWVEKRPQVKQLLNPNHAPPQYETLDEIMNSAIEVINNRPISEETFQGLLSFSRLAALPDWETAKLGLSTSTVAVATSTCTGNHAPVNVFTPKGTLLQNTCKVSNEELQPADIAAINNIAASKFPGSIFVSTATAKYNCHSYAWYNQLPSNDVWIGLDLPATAEDVYWADGSYFERGSQPDNPATSQYVVGWKSDDHSARTINKTAVVTDTANLISKWGRWPVMQHGLRNQPYDTDPITNQRWPTVVTFYDLTPSKPDLYPTALSSNTTGQVGGTLANLSVSYKNQGQVATPAFRVGFYYTTTSTGTGGTNTFSGSACTVASGLAAGAISSCSGSIGIPPTLSPGTYYLKAYVDDQQAVSESNEGNNLWYSGPLTITATPTVLPDLQVTALSSSGTGIVGGTLTGLSVSYMSASAATSTAARVGFYYTSSASNSASAIFSGYSCTLQSGALANVVYTCTGSIGIPSNLTPGSYYLKAYIDDQGAITESNEGNNTRYFGPITITTPQAAQPNLYISSLVAPAGGNAGVTYNHSVAVSNNGTAQAGAFRVGVYLNSANNGTLGTLVGNGTFNSLGTNASGTVNISVTYPNWSGGSYYMQIKVDDLSQVAESNENDNINIKGWVNLNGVTNPIAWDFSTNGNADGWSFQNLAAWSVSGGSLFLDPNNGDYYMYRDTSFTAGSYRTVHIRMASNGTDNVGAVYFKTTNENYYSEDKKLLFTVSNCSRCGNAGFYEYYVSTNHGKWNGTITGLRLDPSGTGITGTNMDSIGLDFFRVEP